MPVVRELISKWGFDVDESALDRMDSRVKNIRSSFAKMGAVAGAGFAAAFVPAAKLEGAIRQTLTLVDAQGEAFTVMADGMTSKALQLSEKLGIAATEVADGFYQVLSAGATALSPEFDALSEVGLKMGKLVGLTAAESVETLADALGGFNLKMTEAGRVADVFFKTSKLAQLTVPQLSQAMREAALSGGSAGQSLEDVSAIIAALAKTGTKGVKAGMAFRMIMTRLGSNKEAQAAIKGLDVEIFNLDGSMRNILDIMGDLRPKFAAMTDQQKAVAAKTIAGEEAFTKLTAILQVSDAQLRSWSSSLKDAGGTLDIAFAQKMEGANEQLGRAWLAIKNLAAAIGGPFLTPVSNAAEAVANFVSGIRDMIEQRAALRWLATMVVGFAGLLAVVSAGVVIFATFALLLTPLTKAFMALRFALVAYGIGQSIATGAAVTFKAALLGVGLAAVKSFAMFVATWVLLPLLFLGFFVLLIDDIVAFINDETSVIGAWGDFLGGLWDELVDWGMSVVDWFGGLGDQMAQAIRDTIPTARKALGDAMRAFGISTDFGVSDARAITMARLSDNLSGNALGSTQNREALAAQVGGGGGSLQIAQDITIQVPAGTDEQQASFIKGEVRRIIAQENERMIRGAQANLGAGRSGNRTAGGGQ